MTIADQKWRDAVEQGELEQAEKYYHSLRSYPQGSAHRDFSMGLWYRNLGRYDDALAAFTRAREAESGERGEILYELALTYEELEQYAQAESLYQEALQAEPHHGGACFDYGRLLARLGRREQAREQFCRVLCVNGRDTESVINVAVELSALGYGDEAIALYQQALVWDGDNCFLYSNMAVELAELGDYDDALFCHQKGLALNSFAGDLWYNLACTYSLMHEEAGGLAALAKAVTLDDENRLYAQNDAELEYLRARPGFWRVLNQ